jgi:hypothetical protein
MAVLLEMMKQKYPEESSVKRAVQTILGLK